MSRAAVGSQRHRLAQWPGSAGLQLPAHTEPHQSGPVWENPETGEEEEGGDEGVSEEEEEGDEGAWMEESLISS